MLCAMHVSTGYAPGPRISAAFIASSSCTCAWLLSRGSQELGRSSLRLHACAGFYPISAESLFWRDCTLRAPKYYIMRVGIGAGVMLPRDIDTAEPS